VNGVKLSPFQDAPLKHNTEIAIGPNVKFRFEVIDSKATELDFKLGSQWPGDAEDADRTIFEQK
jgi:pSer/pThr/pTyr-binding forkhead associated (FHA) protein